MIYFMYFFFFFQAEDGIRDGTVTGVQTCALPIFRVDAMRKLGPEHCLISEFWTKVESPKEYGGLDGVGAFAEAMRGRGFTNRELDIMFKDNPARLLGLPVN